MNPCQTFDPLSTSFRDNAARTEMNRVTQANAAGSEQPAAAVEELNAQATR